jgi:hypothetical protein
MAWFRADDRICEHPKFIAARARGGHSALGVWFHAGTWSNAMQTDGFIPNTWVMLNRAETEAAVLAEVGLWHEDAAREGWQMHDYAEYQPTKAELQAKSEQKRSAGQAGGKQSASRRQAEPKPVPVPEPVTSLRDVKRGARLSEKEIRTRQRLGMDESQPGGTAA